MGEHVYLCIKPRKSSLKIESYTKLVPRFCGSLQIIKTMAYIFVFPSILKAHDVFHISLLKKYVYDDNNIVDWFVIQVESGGEF